MGWIVGILAVILMLVAVSTSRQGTGQRELVVWSGLKDAELVVLKEVCQDFSRRHQLPVRVVQVPFQELQPKVQVSVPVGQGPDLVTGPHDWIGDFVTANLLSPIVVPEEATKEFIPVSLQVMQFGGKPYGLPMSVTALGLVTNRALLPQPPRTFKELIEKAGELTRGDQFGFLFESTDFFFSWPFFGGEGAYIFGPGPNGGLDPHNIGLNNEAGIRAAQLLLDLHLKYHLLPSGVNKNSANGSFLNGKVAMTITGPWSLQEYRAKKIDYVFTPIPPLDNGRYPPSLVGVDGMMLTACSRNKALATQLMLELTGKDVQVKLHLSAGRIPSRRDAQLDARVADNPDVRAIGEAVEKGVPMPTLPQLKQVWPAMETALKLVTNGQKDVKTALDDAVQRMHVNIRKMEE